MVKKLFTTSFNTYSAFVKWRKETVDGSTRFVSTEGAGICVGATITWLKKSIASEGRGIKSAAELGSVFLMTIVHTTYAMLPLDSGVTELEALPSYLSSQDLAVLDRQYGTGMFDPKFVVNWVSGLSGHYIFGFWNKTNNRGHVVGIRRDVGVLEMFDYGMGLYEYPDTRTFIRHLTRFSFEHYSKESGSEWAIFRVGLPVVQ
ncbi:hypothetical protein [Endozoicomonas lisbonensis]|uniref:Peptidase C58 YopT-type domain-containing protein n=1 Tax=Endozoicomonas lisbonensis TaxID=3120522 RepID=A0ABV2SBC0_9GAMM